MTSPRIIVDTREQLPLAPFYLGKGGARVPIETVRAKLQVGDYALEGFEHAQCVERKSGADLYGTLYSGGTDALGEASTNQDRFRAELALAAALCERRLLVIECGKKALDAWIRDNRRRVPLWQLESLLDSLVQDYGLTVRWCDFGRDEAAKVIGTACKRVWDQATERKAADKARARGVSVAWLMKEAANGEA